MPIKKSRKTVWIVLAVVLLAAFVENGCAQAGWASLRIRRGMTVSQALQVSGDWSWGFAYSERFAPESPPTSLWSPRHLPGRRPTPTLRIPGRSSPSRQSANDWPPVAHVADLSGSDALQFRSLLRRTRQGTTRLGHLVYAVVGDKVRRERRWTSAGATPARELVRSTR